jgi:Zn-dependent peptidase ImmA (M78 family)
MKLKIGHLEVKVILDSGHLDGELGKFNDVKSELHVGRDLSPREFVSTLLHEIMHATAYAYGLRSHLLKDKDSEEIICETLGNGLAQALCENRELIKLLKSKVENE